MKAINKLTFIFLMLVSTTVLCATIVDASVKKGKPETANNLPPVEVSYEVVINQGPPKGILHTVDVTLDDITPINMYQDVRDGSLIKVVLGTLKEKPTQYVLSIISKSENGSNSFERITHSLPNNMGSSVRIIGVGTGEDFFLQNEEGNEFVYRVEWSSKNKDVSLLKSCTRRCG
jgi:hypothetical protein